MPRTREVAAALAASPLLIETGTGDPDAPCRTPDRCEVRPPIDMMASDRTESEDRYRRLIRYLPIALLEVDAHEIGKAYDQLRSQGVTDLGTYLEANPDLIEFASEIVRVTGANSAAAALLGAPDDAELIGPVSRLFAATPDLIRRVMIARFEGRRNYSETIKLRTLDGRLLDVRVSVTFPAPPELADVSLVSLEDLTDRCRTEAQLRQLQADFTRAARISTLGELATSIAHEVSQPLAAILTNAEASSRWLGRADTNLEKVGQLTARIVESARRASEIVTRIRHMASRRPPERALLDINEVIHEALLFVRHDLETRSIALSLDLGADLPSIRGDRVQFQQVIVNLLVNSIQAIVQGDALHGHVHVTTRSRPDHTIVITVHDSGPGIEADNLGRVFDGFFTTKEEGIGIGLALCQSIVAAHGGTIGASNHPAGGAMFCFTLPTPTA
jgi:signal transduction histidine kinase